MSENNKDTTLSPGSEEDFIRQLQEQMAAGGEIGAADNENNINMTEIIGNAEPVESDTEIKSMKINHTSKKIHSHKKKKGICSKFCQMVIFFIVPTLLNCAVVYLGIKYNQPILIIPAIAVTSITLGFYYKFLFNHRLRETMDTAERILNEVSHGNLSFDVLNDNELKSSLSELARPIDNVIKEMSDMITKIQLSVLDIVGNSDALSYFANSMANKTTQEEESVSKIDKFVKIMNDNMQNVKNNVQAAYQNSKDSIVDADLSSKEVLSLIEEMKAISIMSDKIVETMHFINDIADETNLLALNAAIQAAHAGDEGRGFGVVATEIRALAESSTEATKSIFQIIDKTVNSIDKGVEASERSKKALNKIIGSIKSTEDLMGEINSLIKDQTDESDKLKGSVGDIRELTKNINSDTQNMKAAISNLSGQAQILNGIIKRFEIHASSIKSDAIFGVTQ